MKELTEKHHLYFSFQCCSNQSLLFKYLLSCLYSAFFEDAESFKAIPWCLKLKSYISLHWISHDSFFQSYGHCSWQDNDSKDCSGLFAYNYGLIQLACKDESTAFKLYCAVPQIYVGPVLLRPWNLLLSANWQVVLAQKTKDSASVQTAI